MTKIKLCGLSRPCDIRWANELRPDYVGFVFAPGSRRYVSPQQAAELKERLAPGIRAVGVLVGEEPQKVADLANRGMIDAIQLHGRENLAYLRRLRTLTDRPILQAFRVDGPEDICRAEGSEADLVLLDSGAGTGMTFDWDLFAHIQRPCFLAGGLTPDNVARAVAALSPYGVDVSSGIETDGYKDREKMAAFVAAVRREDRI